MYRRGPQACQSLVRPATRHTCARYHAASSEGRPKQSGGPRPKNQDIRPRTKALFKKVDHLVEIAAKEPPNFKQVTKISAAEMSRQKNLAGPPKGTRVAASLEKQAFDRGRAEATDMTSSSIEANEAPDRLYEPGTFVEIRKATSDAVGIVVGHRFVDRAMKYTTLVSNGEVWEHSKDDVAFDVPNILPSDLAERCGSQHSPSDKSEHAARVETLRRIREISKEIHDVKNSVSKHTQDLYESLRSPNPKASATTTVPEVARLFSKRPTMITLYAAHEYMMSDPVRFEAAPDYQFSQMFVVRPQEMVERIETVSAWVKQPDSPIVAFAKKAKDIRSVNRRIQEKRRYEEPQSLPVTYAWTKTDKIIIKFLLDNLRTPIGNQRDPFVIGASYIVQKVSSDVIEVADEDIHRLLVDLGVLAPWADIVPLRYDLGLDVEGKREAKGAEMVKKVLESPGHSSTGSPEDFNMKDPLESLRHDFGNLPVYVIDDLTASELDDGVSIESVSGEPGSYWVHVHISDPASILPPTHIFSRNAERQGDTFYLYHTTYPMLPRALTHHPKHGLSLGCLEEGIAQRVLTFSTKINPNGDLVDYKVRPGLIRNLIVRSYDTVDLTLGWQRPQFSYPFGHIPLPPTPRQQLSKADIQNIRRMSKVAQYSNDRRLRDNIFNHSHVQPEIYDVRWPPDSDKFNLSPMQFSGFPKMSYRVSATKAYDVGAHNVIAECMKLACRTASLFCRDRGVPILRRSASQPLIGSESAYQDLLNSRTPTGYIDYWRTHGAILMDTVAGYTAEPKGHFGLGVPDGEGYTRVTSPLRRYGDLLTHWQIQNALLGQKPLVSLEWLEDYAIQVRAKERLRVRASGASNAYYHVLFLRNWLEEVRQGRVRNMLENLTARTSAWPALNIDAKKWQVDVEVEALALKAICVGLPNDDIPPGTELRVQIDRTNLGRRPKIYLKLA